MSAWISYFVPQDMPMVYNFAVLRWILASKITSLGASLTSQWSNVCCIISFTDASWYISADGTFQLSSLCQIAETAKSEWSDLSKNQLEIRILQMFPRPGVQRDCPDGEVNNIAAISYHWCWIVWRWTVKALGSSSSSSLKIKPIVNTDSIKCNLKQLFIQSVLMNRKRHIQAEYRYFALLSAFQQQR